LGDAGASIWKVVDSTPNVGLTGLSALTARIVRLLLEAPLKVVNGPLDTVVTS
jgi:hypothetical protein